VTATDATQESHRRHAPPFSVAVDRREIALDVRGQDRSLKTHASNSLCLAPNPGFPIYILAEDCAAVCDLDHTGTTSLEELFE
jgi:hypothetical protein